MSPDPYHWINGELQRLDAAGLRRTRRVRQSPQAASITLDHHQVVNFGSNDYLGLAAVLSRATPAPLGWGSGASPLITGRSAEHEALEREIAEFERAEAALVFSSGYAANIGAITALAREETVIFSDQKNHASIIDGCRLSGTRTIRFPHADMPSLRALLIRSREEKVKRRLIVSDSLFSMDGDLAKLHELVQLAEEFDAMLLLDEAHATGVFGAGGRGVAEQLAVERSVLVRVGTFSKALGASGGFVVGPQNVIEWMAHAARTYFFSTAPPDYFASVARTALRLVIDEPERRITLLERAQQLRQTLAAMGCNIGSSESQIIPVIIGDAQRTMDFAVRLLERGLFVPGIRPPSVPEGESLLRISLSYSHTPDQIARLVSSIAEIEKRL